MVKDPASEAVFRLHAPASAGGTVLAVLLALLLPMSGQAQPGRGKVKQGNALYQAKKYDAARNRYQDALLDAPGSPVIQFNLGDAAYQMKSYDKALESYQKTLGVRDAAVQAKTYYNIGNALYRTNKLTEAIAAYQDALKLDPSDVDAKYNLEYVRNKLKENAQPQPQDPQNQQNQQNQQQQQQQNKNQDRNKDQQQQPQPQPQEQRKKEMSKEQAEQILRAMNENQKNKQKKTVRASGTMVDKDW
jgi:Ca-activated chloride channel homolog